MAVFIDFIIHYLASFSYEQERRIMVNLIEQSVRSLSLDSVSWRQFLSLSGARLPGGGDSLTYPPGTSLEYLRQSLLTYNTYISTLSLAPEDRPCFAPVGGDHSNSPDGIRFFYVGQVIFSYLSKLSGWTHWIL